MSDNDQNTLSPDMTMADAIAKNPNLPMILMRFHIGGCSLCGFEPEDTNPSGDSTRSRPGAPAKPLSLAKAV